MSARSLLLVALLACAACSPPISTPTETPAPPLATTVSPYSTISGPITRMTLPPTWTNTPTPVPTFTLTPTPITPTATSTPVPNLSDLCDSLVVNYAFADGHTFGWNSVFTLVFGTPLTTVHDPKTNKDIPLTVRFLATQISSGQNLGAQLNGGLVFTMELPISQLPGPGAFTWEVGVYGDGIDESCVHEGHFFVTQSANDLLTATVIHLTEIAPTPTSNVTDEPTSDIPILEGVPSSQ